MTDFENRQVANNKTMEGAANSVQEISVDGTVKGGVLAIENKQAVTGIEGAGVEGVVPVKELSTLPVKDIHEPMKAGDVLGLAIIASVDKGKKNGSYLLSKRRLDAEKVWEKIGRDLQAGRVVEAPVTNVIKGGLTVDVGIRGLVPASMVEDHFVADFSEYEGRALAFKTIETELSENRLVLSHKAVVEAEKESKEEGLLSPLHGGDVVEGRVARLTDFDASVNLGGMDGLVRVSEIARQHVGKPSGALTVGEDVQVKVLSIDPEGGRISLSIKETPPRPWTDIETKAAVGTVLNGMIRRLTNLSTFMEVFPGVEELVHISQISHEHIATLRGVLHEGDQVQVKVLEINPEERRVALSVEALEPKSESQGGLEEGQEYELPEESAGSVMGDTSGNTLSDAREKE